MRRTVLSGINMTVIIFESSSYYIISFNVNPKVLLLVVRFNLQMRNEGAKALGTAAVTAPGTW